jgi:hypothetical protein
LWSQWLRISYALSSYCCPTRESAEIAQMKKKEDILLILPQFDRQNPRHNSTKSRHWTLSLCSSPLPNQTFLEC